MRACTRDLAEGTAVPPYLAVGIDVLLRDAIGSGSMVQHGSQDLVVSS